MRNRRHILSGEKAQSTLEIVMLFIVIVAVLVVMRRFLQGSVIAGIKSNSDKISESKFSPDGLVSYSEDSHSFSNMTVVSGPLGAQNSTIVQQRQWGGSNTVLSDLDAERFR